MRAELSILNASDIAARLLAPLGDRWRHTQAVAARATELAATVAPDERNLLVVAAWWHDLGYAPPLNVTGMHQLATYEARERDLTVQLAEWPREDSAVADALWTADMTTGPTGQRLTYPQRLEEILLRYPPESTVARAMTLARPDIATAIDRTTARLVKGSPGAESRVN